jgi:hypothetical protein
LSYTQLSIVDLAGSERASKTGATPEQLRVRSNLFLLSPSLFTHTLTVFYIPTHTNTHSLSDIYYRKLNPSIKV